MGGGEVHAHTRIVFGVRKNRVITHSYNYYYIFAVIIIIILLRGCIHVKTTTTAMAMTTNISLDDCGLDSVKYFRD